LGADEARVGAASGNAIGDELPQRRVAVGPEPAGIDVVGAAVTEWSQSGGDQVVTSRTGNCGLLWSNQYCRRSAGCRPAGCLCRISARPAAF
jgi:hypothetical protein